MPKYFVKWGTSYAHCDKLKGYHGNLFTDADDKPPHDFKSKTRAKKFIHLRARSQGVPESRYDVDVVP